MTNNFLNFVARQSADRIVITPTAIFPILKPEDEETVRRTTRLDLRIADIRMPTNQVPPVS